MSDPSLVLGQPQLRIPIIAIVVAFVALIVWIYQRQSQARTGIRVTCGSLKAIAFAILAVCLLEPLLQGTRPVPGENVFVLLADQSQSLQIKDIDETKTRGELLLEELDSEKSWQVRLAQDFELRRYWVGKELEKVESFSNSEFNDSESRLKTSLKTMKNRLRSRPLGGVLFFTDGNATDHAIDIPLDDLPPIYPVVQGSENLMSDLEVGEISLTQTNFEAAPVEITTTINNQSSGMNEVVVKLLDESGSTLQEQMLKIKSSAKVTFKVKPDAPGIRFYRIRVDEVGDLELAKNNQATREASVKNNFKDVVVDRGGGPFRVLYVSGRPNWEFKFLNRALAEDDEIQLVGLIRIAKKQPKFDFRRKGESTTSQFFKGFDTNEDEAEQYFEPVLLRLGTEDEHELRGGFPTTADALFRYDAIICDDVEASYFTFEQMNLLKRFVGERGGGFLMLGGQESFAEGNYHRTPIADLLPVYVRKQNRLDDSDGPSIEDPGTNIFRYRLSRTGKLKQWIRLRSTETEENMRLAKMPNFSSLNHVNGLKPGADELAFVGNPAGENHTALVTQIYGKGRSGALLIGDFWRWGLKRQPGEKDDLGSAWRQTVRWLVADVPGRVGVSVTEPGDILSDYRLKITVRNEEYLPLDNAELEILVRLPNQKEQKISAVPSERESGTYEAYFPAELEGNYLATIVAKNPDGTVIESRQAGWTYAPHSAELKKLTPNLEWLESLATQTGGEVISGNQLDQFVNSLPNRKLPHKETQVFPLWHHMVFFLIAIACLAAEWGIRRINGLP